MFSFVFQLSGKQKDLEIIINGHSFKCCKKNAQKISKIVLNNNNSVTKENKKEEETFIISIPEFENTFFCSDDDYQTFKNIFCLIPINITSTNKNVLKIFATNFEITEILTLIALFEHFEDIINNDKNLQILKDISEKLLNITEDDFEILLDHFKSLQQDILTQQFIYDLFLTSCIVRPVKIELLMSFLKKYEETTNGGEYEHFKKLIIDEYDENPKSNEIKFLAMYLNGKEIIHDPRKSIMTFEDLFIFELDNFNTETEYKEEEIEEYENTGFCPYKIYHAIKDDDIDLFTEIMTSGGKKMNFNEKLPHLKHERSSDIKDTETYVDLAAFYGSENIFNYILLNVENQVETLKDSNLSFALIGGNISIVRKYLDNIEMTDNLLINSILTTIKYSHNEIFEYLFENYNTMKFMDDKIFQRNYDIYENHHFWIISYDRNNGKLNFNDLLIARSIKYNNYYAICYLLMNGFDYTSLLTLSLIYNQFYLAELAFKLPYECQFSSKNIKDKCIYPFLYKYGNESALFVSIYKNKLDFVKKIVNSEGFKPNVTFEKAGPLFFAVINNKIDIVKFLIEDKRFSNKQIVDSLSIFQYAVGHGYKELSEFLINRPDVTKSGEWMDYLASNLLNEIQNGRLINIDGFDYDANEGNPLNYTNFFLSKTTNEAANENKEKIVKQNIVLFTCLAARYLNEDKFEKFLDEYNIDINANEEKTVFIFLFFK